MDQNNHTLDIGCGQFCLGGAIGIDRKKYPAVKYVHDLNVAPWPVEETFTYMRCQHVIEHITNLEVLVSEIFRLAENGCIVHFITPHFSSSASWGDPTHIHHFSLSSIPQLFDMVLGKEKFVLLKNEIKFNGSIFELIGWLICRVSPKKYEKYFAWRHPANEINTVIRIVK
ncbi:MAG TPA: hypothetical protein VLX91_00295 [Candidatus Acidoferrales bacterium]|nr:hypothetical protein [Candidatus Acidoferrales bacterium]